MVHVIFSIIAICIILVNNEGIWYVQVNLIYSWLCEGSIYLGERIMYLSFAFEIVGLQLKKLVDVFFTPMYSNGSPLAVVKRQLSVRGLISSLPGLISSLPICLQTNSSSMTLIAEPVSINPLHETPLTETEIQ